MGFFDNFKSKQDENMKKMNMDLTQIGESEPICPYCKANFEKMPLKKTNCPSCKNDVFVRTRPFDEKKILIKDVEIDEIERQWAIKSGTLDQYNQFLEEREQKRRRFEEEKLKIKEKIGYEPRDNDVQWALFNLDRINYIDKGKLGLYRNTTMYMADQLKKEKKYSQAIKFYLEVTYLDINLPTNSGTFETDEQFLKEYKKSWGRDYEYPSLRSAPGIIKNIKIIQKKENISVHDLNEIFINHIGQVYKNKSWPPLSPEKAWEIFVKEYNQF